MEHSSDSVLDPVCLMQINPQDAAAKVEYKGRRWYFCAENCRRAFEQDPDRFAGRAA